MQMEYTEELNNQRIMPNIRTEYQATSAVGCEARCMGEKINKKHHWLLCLLAASCICWGGGINKRFWATLVVGLRASIEREDNQRSMDYKYVGSNNSIPREVFKKIVGDKTKFVDFGTWYKHMRLYE